MANCGKIDTVFFDEELVIPIQVLKAGWLRFGADVKSPATAANSPPSL